MLVIKGTPDLSLGGSVNVGLEGKRGWFAPLYDSYQGAKQVAARCKVVIFQGSNRAYYMPEGVRGSLVGANSLVGTPYSGKSTSQKIIGLTDERATNTWKNHVKKKFSVLDPEANFTEGSWPLSIEKSTRNVGYTGGDTDEGGGSISMVQDTYVVITQSAGASYGVARTGTVGDANDPAVLAERERDITVTDWSPANHSFNTWYDENGDKVAGHKFVYVNSRSNHSKYRKYTKHSKANQQGSLQTGSYR